MQQQHALEALSGITNTGASDRAGSAAADAAVVVAAATETGAGETGAARGAAAFKPPPSAQAEMDEVYDDPFADPFVGGGGFSSMGLEAYAPTCGRAASAAN